MQISENNNSSSFKALHLPRVSHVERVYGSYMSTEMQKATPELEKLAQDVDVFVDTNENWGFDIEVREIPKNIFQKIFGKMKSKETHTNLAAIANLTSFTIKADGEFVPEIKSGKPDMSEYLVNTTKSAIDQLKQEITFNKIF